MASAAPQQIAPKAAPPLPRLRDDLALYPGSSHRDGSPSWRIHDPVRNAFFEIGWLEFELLARWSAHRTAAPLIAQVSAETPLTPTAEEVSELVEFLATNQLLAPDAGIARDTIRRKWIASKLSWYEYILHHYLFFRLPLVKPDAFLSRTVGLTDLFFTRSFLLVVLVVLGIDLYLAVREWHEFTDAFISLLTPIGLFYYGVALTFAKVVHELGHAYTAKRYGVRVPAMGLAFLVMWPYLYTDTAETWKLANHRKQFAIAAAGMAAEFTLAVFATLFWALAPEGGVKTVLFVLATSTWIMTLAINASPFMRFDGYFLLSDALDFPNLHERAGVCARWWLRTTFFQLPLAMPEPSLDRRQVRWLVAFALVTWLYRLTVFFGIALMVYFMFFKLLGFLMMLLELYWFIVRPVANELTYLWSSRRAISIAWTPTLVVAALAAVLVWMIPVSGEVTAPALLRAAREQAVYAPFPARVLSVGVGSLEKVDKGALLVDLDAPDLKSRAELAQVAITSAQLELARTPASERQQERQGVLEQQLNEAIATMQSVREDAARQRLFAAHAGTIRDLQPDVVPGQWVNPRQLLLRVVSESEPLIEAYVGERQLDAIAEGQAVRFYPSLPNMPVMEGTVVEVDRTPIREISRLVMASAYGGDIVVDHSPGGALVAHEAVYRVSIKPRAENLSAASAIRGTVRIEGGFRFVAENFLYRTISVLIRESGF